MQLVVAFILGTAVMAAAQTGDRVCVAEQTSNTVSVIDPATNKMLSAIHLGEDVPAALLPLYRRELLCTVWDFLRTTRHFASSPSVRIPSH